MTAKKLTDKPKFEGWLNSYIQIFKKNQIFFMIPVMNHNFLRDCK